MKMSWRVQKGCVHSGTVAVFFLIIWLTQVYASVPWIAEETKLHSYICLSANQQLCLGISSSVDPIYNPKDLYNLQVKRRDRNEEKKVDYMKMRWTVSRGMGRIQLSNFTSLCLAKFVNNGQIPGEVVLRPCGTQGVLEDWELGGFLTNSLEQSTIQLKSTPDQCLTLMTCDRGTTPQTDNCDPFSTTAYTSKRFNENALRGTYVKLMPCGNGTIRFSQQFRQTIDCSPGCSPFMMQGADNRCDQECANDACNWDNMTCATPSPTPPTLRPTNSPSTSPTTSLPTTHPSRSPTVSPTTSMPSLTPTTSLPTTQPSRSPTVSPTTSMPSFIPSRSPTTSPTISRPTMSPTVTSPTNSPSAVPTTSPTTSIPSLAPSAVPSTSPSVSPSTTPSQGPTTSPTTSPSVAPSGAPSQEPTAAPSSHPTLSPTRNTTIAAARTLDPSDPLLWLWILLGVLGALLLCCCCFFFGFREKKKRDQEKKDKELADQKMADDIESPQRLQRPSGSPNRNESSPDIIFTVSDGSTPVSSAKKATIQQSSIHRSVARNLFGPSTAPTAAAAAAAAAATPNKRSADSDHFVLDDELEINTEEADKPVNTDADTPRTAAAKNSLSPNPDKRPRGGAPGLAWGGGHADLSDSMRGERNEIQKRSENVRQVELPASLNERSFRMPKEKITEGEGVVDVSVLARGGAPPGSDDPRYVTVVLDEGKAAPKVPAEEELTLL